MPGRMPWKRDKIEILAMLLQGALEAEGRVGLKMNVPKDKLDQVTGAVALTSYTDDFSADGSGLGGS